MSNIWKEAPSGRVWRVFYLIAYKTSAQSEYIRYYFPCKHFLVKSLTHSLAWYAKFSFYNTVPNVHILHNLKLVQQWKVLQKWSITSVLLDLLANSVYWFVLFLYFLIIFTRQSFYGVQVSILNLWLTSIAK